MNKFEKLVELIINENEEKAQALFHDIVVEKSREIYNQLVSEDEDSTDDFISDIDADEEGSDISMDDAADDLEGDLGMDGDDDMEADFGDGEIEDRVVDLEAALDDLKAEFEAIMGGADDMGAGDDMDMGDDFSDDADMDDMDMGDGDMEDEDEFAAENFVREYTEKVGSVNNSEGSEVAKGGSVPVNKQSIVAKKNDMGGTTANMVKGGTATDKPAQKAQAINVGNRNVPGGKAGNMEKAPAPKKGE